MPLPSQPSPAARASRFSDSRLFALTCLALAGLLAWDFGGLDLPLARVFGTPAGFPLRDDGFMVSVMHVGARNLSWVVAAALALAIRWPFGALRRLSRPQRVQLVLTTLACITAVSALKYGSHTSCPWDLQSFGGVARQVSHWAWGARDGGPGNCFPAGHASAGFAFLGGYFVFRRNSPAIARAWLAAVLIVGCVLGLAQQARGAHFMSHTLWTGWICWSVAFGIDRLLALRSGWFVGRRAVPVVR